MSRSSDPAKIAEWRQRFRRFSKSGLTVVEFCGKGRISTPTFYHWRKKVAKSPARKPKVRKSRVFQQVAIVGSSQAVSIQLVGGTRIEVGSENMDTIRTVVGELVRADHDCHVGGTPC